MLQNSRGGCGQVKFYPTKRGVENAGKGGGDTQF